MHSKLLSFHIFIFLSPEQLINFDLSTKIIFEIQNIKYEIALKLMQETPFKYEKQNRTIIRGIFK